MENNSHKQGTKKEENLSQNIIEARDLVRAERITKGEAAIILGVEEKTIENYIQKNLLTKFKLGVSRQAKVYLIKKEVLGLLGLSPNENMLIKR